MELHEKLHEKLREKLREKLMKLNENENLELYMNDFTTTYYFDEDTAAVADILIDSGGRDKNALIAILVARDSALFNRFFVRIWQRFSEEAWIVSQDGTTVEITKNYNTSTHILKEAIETLNFSATSF